MMGGDDSWPEEFSCSYCSAWPSLGLGSGSARAITKITFNTHQPPQNKLLRHFQARYDAKLNEIELKVKRNIFLKMHDPFFENGRQPHFLEMEDDLKKLMQ